MAGFSTAPGSYVSNYTEVTSQYVANTAGVGYAVGDTLQKTQTFNPATTPPTVLSTVWSNLTQQTTGLAVPLTADIDAGTPVVTKGYTSVLAEFLYIGFPEPEYDFNDMIQAVYTYDNSVNPAVLVNTVWNNATKNLYPTVVAPVIGDLAPVKNPPNQIITDNYFAIATAAGFYTIGDVLQRRTVMDYADKFLPAVRIGWTNLTTQVDILGPVLAADVVPVQSASGSATSLLQTNLYYAITAGTDYAVNDVLEQQIVLNTSTNPPTADSVIWTNLTTGLPVNPPEPDLAEIRPVGTPSSAIGASGTVTNRYLAISGSAQASAGEIVEEVISYNLATNPPTVIGSTWYNVTSGTAITPANAPDYVTLAALGTAQADTTRVAASNLYYANTANTDYSVADIINCVTVFNTNTTPPTPISTHYDNLTTGSTDITVTLSELTALGGPVPNPSTIDSRQLTTAITPQQAPSQPYQNGVVITADGSNSNIIYVGGDNTVSSTTGYPLVPGQSMSYGVSNLNGIWFLGFNTTDKLFVSGN